MARAAKTTETPKAKTASAVAATTKGKAAPAATTALKGKAAGQKTPTAAEPAKVSKAKAAAAEPVAKVKGGKTKAAAAPPAPAKAAVVTLKHLAAGLSERHGIAKREAESFAADLMADLVDQIKAGSRMKIAGLGILEVKDKPARMARNPATGAPVQVPASRKIAFRPSKDLKEAI